MDELDFTQPTINCPLVLVSFVLLLKLGCYYYYFTHGDFPVVDGFSMWYFWCGLRFDVLDEDMWIDPSNLHITSFCSSKHFLVGSCRFTDPFGFL